MGIQFKMKYNDGKIDYASQTDLYVNKCANYLHAVGNN